MRLIVGLGNPGREFSPTRHNVGFQVVEELACRWNMRFGPPHHGIRDARGMIAGTPVLLVQPQMYMNRSGPALADAGAPVIVTDMIVIHDDIDLECGRLRIKRGGGSAGHNGVTSIADHYGADFIRVRVGVGRPPAGADVGDHVLSGFDAGERAVIALAVQRAADAVECVLRDGEEAARNRFNMRPSSGLAVAAAPTGRS